MIIIHKPSGLTPLQAIEQYKNTHPELRDEVISYAGRLDPMAEGQLLLLIGAEENKHRRQYEKLDKTYEFEILVGFSTDTYDIMGMITFMSLREAEGAEAISSNVMNSLIGTHTFPYPPYSSKYVKGHPLYWYAKRNLLNTITIPTQTVTIYTAEVLSKRIVSSQELLASMEQRLRIVQGNFRQEEILIQWQKIFTSSTHSPIHQTYPVITCNITCSSGTYIRSIVHYLSQQLNIPLLAFTIKRTSIKLLN